MQQLISKAPGRVCLFGDHQDYLELPIIACAIDQNITITGALNNKNHFEIMMSNLGSSYYLNFTQNTPTPHTKHLIHALEVVKAYGCHPDRGFKLTFDSELPINAGLSSSSAVVVAWIQWLLHTYGCTEAITPKFIGQLAYEAEVLKSQGSGGKMDQFTSAIGGTIYLETNSSSAVTPLSSELKSLVIGVSGIPKDTEGMLGKLKTNVLKAIHSIQKKVPKFDLATATLTDYEEYQHLLETDLKPYLFAAIKNHCITRKARLLLSESSLNTAEIGSLMSAHHTLLKDYLKITVPRIDQMISAALDAKAYGAKIVGSGGGGSIVALVPIGKEANVIDAIKAAGASAAYTTNIAQGAHIL